MRDDVTALIKLLREHHQHRMSSEYFLQNFVAGIVSRIFAPVYSKIERAARALFINRTCYNGLYRLNRKGQFNAPFGYYKNPMIYDPDNLRAASVALRNVDLRVADFAEVLNVAANLAIWSISTRRMCRSVRRRRLRITPAKRSARLISGGWRRCSAHWPSAAWR